MGLSPSFLENQEAYGPSYSLSWAAQLHTNKKDLHAKESQ